MRNFVDALPDGKRQFDGACEAIKKVGAGKFMILPGDFDPPEPVRAMIDRYLGADYFCYFVVGDHEARAPASMNWFHHWAQRDLPGLVRRGPPARRRRSILLIPITRISLSLAIISTESRNASPQPDISDETMAWLEKDLAATKKPLIWVTCHKPIECLPDMDSGRARHAGDSLIHDAKRREKFVALLNEFHVRALLCGHTHGSSIAKIQGIWQADSGHARGAGDPGAPSTFLKIRVSDKRAWADIYRADPNGQNYQLRKTIELN